jgi:Mg-chelatase subunit ChlD
MSLRNQILWRSGLLFAAAALLAVPAAADEPAKKPAERPEVEVVFCLDTTGSMGGLIHAAKQKIWAICNQIAGGTPTPRVKVGLVAFRDRGDAYVTKVFDLTDDLDGIHGHLMGFQAQGGGDFPESVNQALHESVTKIKWSDNPKTLKLIFLVGDAPPHMDYPDDVKYPETCQLAAKRGIIINAVQCGNHPETRKYWQDICRLAEGSYVQIGATGGPVVTIATPYDTDLAKINTELTRTTLTYGSRAMQAAGETKKAKGAALPAGVAADRAGYYARTHSAASYDLLQNIKDGKVKLEDVKKEELPQELQKLSLPEQRAYLEKLDKSRTELMTKAADLDKKRAAYIAQKQKEDVRDRGRDSFDNQVLLILRRQAARSNIAYGEEEKKK